MYRLAYRIYRMWTGFIYWFLRRFTKAGRAAMAILVIAAMAGVDTQKSLTHQVCAWLFFMLLAAVLCAVRFRFIGTVERLLPRIASVGMRMPYRVRVRNESNRLQQGLVVMENLEDPRPGFAEFKAQLKAEERHGGSFRLRQPRKTRSRKSAVMTEAPLPSLPPGGQADVTLELLPLRRGVVRFAGITIARPDPLGLYKAYNFHPAAGSVLILPKRYFIPPIALPGSMKYQQGGVALASAIGESEEFVSLREYRPGDPLRRIHWRSFAKLGKPIVRECEDEFFVRHALILDTFSDEPDSYVFEEAVSVAASFACSVTTQESLLDLLFVGNQAYCFTVGRGVGHTDQMLEILAAVQICLDRKFSDLGHLVLHHVGMVSGCIFVLIAWDEARQTLVRQLRQLGVPLLVIVIVEKGQPTDLDPGPMRECPESFHVMDVESLPEKMAALRI